MRRLLLLDTEHGSGQRAQQMEMLLPGLMRDILSPGLTGQKRANYHRLSLTSTCILGHVQTYMCREREEGDWGCDGRGEHINKCNKKKEKNRSGVSFVDIREMGLFAVYSQLLSY